ncbi:MAG: YggT family protein [Chloroflexales bacterium]|nr:YggT family protein [Chloroflexales bacterium]
MSERKYERVTDSPATGERDVYRETVSEGAVAPLADDAAREVVHERVASATGERVVHSEHVREPSEAMRRGSAVTRTRQVISFIFGIIGVLIVVRFVLLLLGASETSGFVQFVYNLSRPFVAPFFGIFGEPTFGSSVIEWASLVAIIVYSLVAYGLARLVELIYAPARPTVS